MPARRNRRSRMRSGLHVAIISAASALIAIAVVIAILRGQPVKIAGAVPGGPSGSLEIMTPEPPAPAQLNAPTMSGPNATFIGDVHGSIDITNRATAK